MLVEVDPATLDPATVADLWALALSEAYRTVQVANRGVWTAHVVRAMRDGSEIAATVEVRLGRSVLSIHDFRVMESGQPS